MAEKSNIPPDPSKMNGLRAKWAAAAVEKHARGKAGDPFANLSELLCNLRHWADRQQVDFTDALLASTIAYGQETEGPEQPAKKNGRKK